MIKVECKVTSPDNIDNVITIRNHWNWNDRIELEIPGSIKATFNAQDLITAVQNCTHVNRY